MTLALLLITALGCVQELRAWPDVRGGPLPLPGVIWTLRYVSGRGWVAPLLVTTHPGAHGLLPAAILVTASELALSWYAARTGDWASRVAGALRLPSANSFQVPYGQANVVGTWAYDSVVRHPEQPDLAPWELFLRHDEVLAHHPLCKGVVRDWAEAGPLRCDGRGAMGDRSGGLRKLPGRSLPVPRGERTHPYAGSPAAVHDLADGRCHDRPGTGRGECRRRAAGQRGAQPEIRRRAVRRGGSAHQRGDGPMPRRRPPRLRTGPYGGGTGRAPRDG
ncbi:hypothetical protein ACRJ4W_12135 [Streptomyces sp. GLT-R25]